MISLIDTHIHFDDDRFDTDRSSVYNNAKSAGVSRMIIPATTRARWSKIFSLSEQYTNVYPTAGLHPVFINDHSDDDLQLLDETLQKSSCVALGECGLDGFVKDLDYEKQQYFFSHQIELAAKHKLPLIIHARNAVEDVTLAIKSAKSQVTGVVHSYNGSLQQAQQLIGLGFLLSFGGAITYDRATRLNEIVKELPLDSIMVETDAPDQPTQTNAGNRNEPAFLPEVVTAIAEIKNLQADDIILASNANATRLFNLPKTH